MKNKFRIIYRNLRMVYLRKKLKLTKVHKTFYMGGKSFVSSDLKAGFYSYIGPNCILYKKVEIGNYSMLANDVSIIGADHNYNQIGTPIIFSGKPELKETKIGNDVWVGAYTKIKTGVTIGDGVIIAMGSVVTKDVPAYTIYGGVPAKEIKKRFSNIRDIEKHNEMLSKNYKELGFGFKNLL